MSPEERQQLVTDIASALKQAQHNELTDEERQWVRLAIAAEARKIKFRDAVIEKSLGALTIAAISGFGYILLDFLRNHGLKL
jgi:chorismate mutase